MKYSIFASREVSFSSNSRQLERFDTPDEAHGTDLARTYTDELCEQGWEIHGVYEANVDEQPAQKYPRKRR